MIFAGLPSPEFSSGSKDSSGDNASKFNFNRFLFFVSVSAGDFTDYFLIFGDKTVRAFKSSFSICDYYLTVYFSANIFGEVSIKFFG